MKQSITDPLYNPLPVLSGCRATTFTFSAGAGGHCHGNTFHGGWIGEGVIWDSCRSSVDNVHGITSGHTATG